MLLFREKFETVCRYRSWNKFKTYQQNKAQYNISHKHTNFYQLYLQQHGLPMQKQHFMIQTNVQTPTTQDITNITIPEVELVKENPVESATQLSGLPQ